MADQISTELAENEYVFQEKALQLASKFFKIEDTSLLKVGTLGYTTALATHMMRDGVFHRDMLLNEQFLISANLNSTLYNWAKTLDHNIDLAVPSNIPIAIKVPIRELESLAKAEIGGDTKTFVFSKDDSYDVGGFNFLLPHDIVVYFYRSNNQQLSVNATYDLSTYTYQSNIVSSPYLKTLIMNENGVDYVVINAHLFQIEKYDYITTMASNDILESSIIERPFGGNMASFQAFYNPNDNVLSDYRPMELIFNDINAPTTEVYGFYTFLGSDTVRVYFSSQPTGFRPAFNSKVKLSIYTTKAEEGNFNYSGNIRLKDERLDDMNVLVMPMQSSARGGTSIKSFIETKRSLINKLKTRDNYTTTYDLETFLDEAKRKQLKSNSEYQVVKLRDDIFRRQFSLYVLERNSDNVTIPTNTVDIDIPLDKVQSMDYSIKPGTLIIYDRINSKYRILDDDELPEMYLNASDSYLYSVPFLINIDLKQHPKSNIFYTNFNKTISLKFNDFNIKTPYQIILNTFSLQRNPLFDIDNFNLSCFLNTESADLDKVKLRAFMYDSVNNQPVGYFDLDRVNNSSEFLSQVRTSDNFDSDGNYVIENTIHNVATGDIIPKFSLLDRYRLRFALFINDGVLNTEKSNPVYANMTDLKDYAFIFDMDAEEEIAFAEDLSDIMYCQTIIRTSENSIRINKIPLISALFYMNTAQNKQIMDSFYDNLMVVKRVASQLENNTSIDVKFFNTYGISQYFDSDTIDINLNIEVALNESLSKRLDQRIKESIVSFVESCNSRKDTRFSLSNLTTHLENSFSEIRYIKIRSVNNAFIQNISKVKYVSDKTEDLPYDFVPEYLTVHKGTPKSAINQDFDYSIDITYI